MKIIHNHYPFTQQAKSWHDTLHLRLKIETSTNIDIKIICTSTGRRSTTYEIFDENSNSMGGKDFTAAYGYTVPYRFNKSLVDNLNVLLEEHNFQLEINNFFEISERAVQKCESRYGYSITGGDCIIHITNK